jgi:hypothetical protein
LLLNATFPQGAQVTLGRHTLQTFSLDELRRIVPAPALHGLHPWSLDLDLIADAPFLCIADLSRKVTRRRTWVDFAGPRAEAQHWPALLPLMLWDDELLRVDSVFTVQRGRRFDLHPSAVPTTIRVYSDHQGRDKEVEVRDTGEFHVRTVDLSSLSAFCAAMTTKIEAIMAGLTHVRRLPRLRARRLERACRHLVAAYQRTYGDYRIWEVEADELYLNYVIALEALLISPSDSKDEGFASRIRSRAAALFLTPSERERAEALVQRAYQARSRYVHGDEIKEQSEREKQEELRGLRLLTLQVILRWLILTPAGTDDLGPLLDASVHGSGREHIDRALRAFFSSTPPRSQPADFAVA